MVSRKKLILGAVAAATILVMAALLIASLPRDQGTFTAGISVKGLVNHELNISLDGLKYRPNVTIKSELICVSGKSLGNHSWTGVRLKDILDEAGVKAGAIKVAFYAYDNYSTDLTLQKAMRDDVIIAFLEDGAPLHEKTKLVVPGDYGYKWISWIESVQVVDFDFLGTYESAGYADDASISG